MKKRKYISILLIGLLSIMLTACGSVDVKQNTDKIEVGTNNIRWNDYITVADAEKYNVSCDASQFDIESLGKYTVVYTITNKESKKEITKEFSFDVVDTTAPTITAKNKETTLKINESVNLMNLVDIVDNYDGVLTKDNVLQLENNIDITQEGQYTVNYVVADSSGNKASFELPVKVVKYILTPIDIGDKINKEFVEMSILDYGWSETIKPLDTSRSYSYKPNQDGESYFLYSL